MNLYQEKMRQACGIVKEEGVDVWLGSATELGLTAVICTVDLVKGDSELKLLLGCTREEEQTVLAFHNQNQFVRGMLIPRPAFF